mgnify:CR=1 FL=1
MVEEEAVEVRVFEGGIIMPAGAEDALTAADSAGS